MPSVNVLDVGASSVLGSRATQEDRYLHLGTGSLKSSRDLALFAVYDGHGGQETVEHVNQNLVINLESQFSATSRHLETEEYKQAIQRALRATDRDLGEAGLRGGSTVVLALVDTKQGVLVATDLGDSHIVYVDRSSDFVADTKNGVVFSEDGEEPKTEVLSVEHSPAHPEEKKRVEDAGGQINYLTGIPRIGGVSMARALGDMQLKKPRVNRLAGHDLSDLVGVETGVAPGKRATQDLVSNRAHFTTKKIRGQTLVLLASDGVGDAKDAEHVARLAMKRWFQGKSAQEITTEITTLKGAAAGADNCTVVVVVLDVDSKRGGSSSSLRYGSIVGTRKRRRSERRSMSRLIDWIC